MRAQQCKPFAELGRIEIARRLRAIEEGEDTRHWEGHGAGEEGGAVIGFTGSPGVGKSSLVNAIVEKLATSEGSIAVLAVDPSSPYSGGAILGDRARMDAVANLPTVLVKSVASRGAQGGLAATTARHVAALRSFGFDWIFVETVGAGQAETRIMNVADVVCVVVAPGFGDELQAIKAGILEIAGLLVVNKSDAAGVEAVLHALRGSVPPDLPILRTSAVERRGIEDLVAAIVEHVAALREGTLYERRLRAMCRELLSECGERLADLASRYVAPAVLEREAARVLRREASVDDAIENLLSPVVEIWNSRRRVEEIVNRVLGIR